MRRMVLAVALVLVVAAALWRPLAIPRLVRFPSDVDETTHYAGEFTVYVDPATGQRLAEPMELPLEIDRRVRTLPGGGADSVVLEEAVTYRIAGTTQQERHHYVIDRRSMQHRDDPRSWSFAPENHIEPAGTYRVTLPFGTAVGGRYRIWENEPGRSFWMASDPARARVRQNGLALVGMQEVWHGAPVAPYYRAELVKQGFAIELTFPQLSATLAAGGVDVEGALASLPPAAAPVVAAAREARVPLRFVRDNDGHALVEPRTGEIVDLVYSDEAIRAAPDLAPLRDLHNVLAEAATPESTALAEALDALDRAPPAPVYSLRYEQTPASVAAAAERARDDLRQLDIVERYVPWTLALSGLVLLLVTVLSGRRARSVRARRRAGRRQVGRRADTGWAVSGPGQERPGGASS